jgi:hypothetical protein
VAAALLQYALCGCHAVTALQELLENGQNKNFLLPKSKRKFGLSVEKFE